MARGAKPKPAYVRSGPLVEFGRRIRAFRHARAMSQEAVADGARLHSTYVSSVERGERNISLINILVLGDALDIDPALLITGDRAAFEQAVAATKPRAPRRAR